jgi:hypothetical protein
MPGDSNLLSVTDSAASDKISLYVYRAILEIQQQHPEWLKEKYRKVAWQHIRHQTIFLERLKAELCSAQESKVQLLKLRKFLQLILENGFFESADFKGLIEKVHRMLQPETLSPSQDFAKEPVLKSTGAIAILLLDAENLHLNSEAEKFLANICTYPIQIKVAFANWRSMGKKDLELHERHYELIHVPPGKDSADLKMSTVGSSIFVHYPTAKEVLVCSSDNALTHLCTTLQTHGLTVYRVRKNGEVITVFNSKTSKTHTHSLKAVPEIPSVEEFVLQLKQLIKKEQERTGSQWIKLSRVSNLYQTKHQLTMSQVVTAHFPGKKSRDVFSEYPSEFASHRISAQSPLYITLFEIPKPNPSNGNGSITDSNELTPVVADLTINSEAELEQALANILQALTIKNPGSAIPISILGSVFYKQHGQTYK